MSVSKAIKLYRSKGLLNDNEHDLPAIDALLDAGYTIKWHGQLTGLKQLTPNGPGDFDAGHAKWGMEFLDRWGNTEYWCVIEK